MVHDSPKRSVPLVMASISWFLLTTSISAFSVPRCQGFCNVSPRSTTRYTLPKTTLSARRTTPDTDTDNTSTVAGSTPRTRRDAISTAFSLACTAALTLPHPASAAVTDETGSPENDYPDTAYSRRPLGLDASSAAPPSTDGSRRTPTDETTVAVPVSETGDGLGIKLADVEFRTNRRVYVAAVSPGSVADRLGVRPDWILVSVDGTSVERTDAKGAATTVAAALRSASSSAGTELTLVFRDPAAFSARLRTLEPSSSSAATRVAPSGDTTQRNPDGSVRTGVETVQEDQRLAVSQLVGAPYCGRRAERDDLLEISYLGTVAETGVVFDGSAIRVNGEVVPGRGNDTTLYFVLGKQPFGQFPPSWDVGLEGICVGERRRIVVPPVLAFGSKGAPRRNIPPDAYLQYDVTLVSLNGLATP